MASHVYASLLYSAQKCKPGQNDRKNLRQPKYLCKRRMAAGRGWINEVETVWISLEVEELLYFGGSGASGVVGVASSL